MPFTVKRIKEKCESCKGKGWIERDCCQEQDLVMSKKLSDLTGKMNSIAFCIHCGSILREASRIDAAGSREYYYKEITDNELSELFTK